MPENKTASRKPFVIAVDGPSASGKGSLARALADHYDYDFLDTGALYRRTALRLLEVDGDKNNEEDAVLAAAYVRDHAFEPYDEESIRNDDVGQLASYLSQTYQGVRDVLLKTQTDFAQNAQKGAVLDGRDIATVICPDADIKLFVTADTAVRAERRLKELQSRGLSVTRAQVLAEMKDRDRRDEKTLSKHKVSAHETAGIDNIVLDTSSLNARQVFEKAVALIEEKKKSL